MNYYILFLFLLFSGLPSLTLAMSYENIDQRLGIFYKVEGEGRQNTSCTAFALDSSHIIMMNHCLYKKGGTQRIDLDQYIFIAGEDSSRYLRYDWKNNYNGFRQRARKVDYIVEYSQRSDYAVLRLKRNLTLKPISSWSLNTGAEHGSLFSYAKYRNIKSGKVYFVKSEISISRGSFNKEGERLFYQISDPSTSDYEFLSTDGSSGGIVIDAQGSFIGLHKGEVIGDSEEKVASLQGARVAKEYLK